MFGFDKAELISSKPFGRKGNHHHPSDEEQAARDKRLFVYRYNQGGEKTCRDNSSHPYPSCANIRSRMETTKYRHDQFREDQKKWAFNGWERMDTKRQLEDSLRDAQGEIADLKAQVDTLEFLVEKLTRPVPEVPKEAVFRVASPPLPDIGFPPSMEIPGLTVNQTTIDEFLDWSSFDRSWPHGGYEADVEKDGDGDSNKENKWVTVPVDE